MDKLNIFIVSVVWHVFLDLLRPPLHPRLCFFFFGAACDVGPSPKKKMTKLQSGRLFHQFGSPLALDYW